VAVSPKFWVFTLGAIAAIAESEVPSATAVLTFLAFVALALSVNLAMVGFSAVSPSRSADLLRRLADWLERNNRVIKIVLGAVFGTWFLFKALSGFGLI
jgi:threonine/homoserine/homoserine lactone efflux protein